MGCPCSAKTHPRQSGATSQSPSEPPADNRVGATRGYHWTGPRQKADAPPPAPAPSE